MIKIDYHLYELINKTSKGKRTGALLRVRFDDGRIGYADCHSWHELGDLPLQKQLDRLKEQSPTILGQCALRLARLDAEGRHEKRSLLDNAILPVSHFLVSDFLSLTPETLKILREQGFTHLKVKMGRQLDLETERLLTLFTKGEWKLRLDFNEALTGDSFRRFLKQIEGVKSFIDFIEDPFPFHAAQWQEIQKEGWVLAADRHTLSAVHHPKAAAVLIIKPAILQESAWKNGTTQRHVVTSYLGHPLGQLAAAYVAGQIDPDGKEIHGLLSHHTYLPDPFSQKLTQHGARFSIPHGAGFGYASELDALKWTSLL